MSAPRDMTFQGKRYGHLLVNSPTRLDGKSAWVCICDCGKEHIAKTAVLKRIKSCGKCSFAKAIISRETHGMTRTPEASSWSAMRTRCNNPLSKDFKQYGGRGIKVCARWDSFENFYADMGNRPKGTTLERMEVNGDYTPENCRWASPKEQGRNRRSNRLVETDYGEITLASAAEICGKSSAVLAWRIDRLGMTPQEAMQTPMMRKREKAIK